MLVSPALPYTDHGTLYLVPWSSGGGCCGCGNVARGATAEHVPWCAHWLAGLAQVGRLTMTVMMLDRATLGQLRAMFAALEGLAGWKDEGSPSLRATFGVA